MNLRAKTLIGVSALAVLSGSALADVSLQVLRISSSVAGGAWEEKMFFRSVDQPVNPSSTSWVIPAESFANGAEFDGATISIIQDPVVTLNFNASAGASNTAFVVDSLLLSFPTIGNLEAVASAAISITDSGLFSDGFINFTGGFAGNSAYQARINNNAFNFASLINDFTLGVVGGGALGTVALPPGSTGVLAPFAGPSTATSISSHFSFSLSARDRIAGTSTFQIVPAPGAAALSVLGLALVARRRR